MDPAPHCPPRDTITPPYTPVITKRDLPKNDWSDLEVVPDLGSGTDTWNSGGVPGSGFGGVLYVCGIESRERRERAVRWVSTLLLWGLTVMVFSILYAGESGGVTERVGGGHDGAYGGPSLWEWSVFLLQFASSRGGVQAAA